jgi:hypothetical protein
LKDNDKIFAVAPMMDWTDRRRRVFHRQMSRHALLYTEMVTALAVTSLNVTGTTHPALLAPDVAEPWTGRGCKPSLPG